MIPWEYPTLPTKEMHIKIGKPMSSATKGHIQNARILKNITWSLETELNPFTIIHLHVHRLGYEIRIALKLTTGKGGFVSCCCKQTDMRKRPISLALCALEVECRGYQSNRVPVNAANVRRLSPG